MTNPGKPAAQGVRPQRLASSRTARVEGNPAVASHKSRAPNTQPGAPKSARITTVEPAIRVIPVITAAEDFGFR